jgi:arylsulfatase A-like enzyme
VLTRRNLLAGSVAALSGLAAPRPKPNFLLILLDDLRYNALGCLGHPWLKTPNIDRLAAEGAIFRNAFVTTPLCSPSRATFLTGRWAHAHGITDNTDRSASSHQLSMYPALLQKAGYETAFIGKLHMGNDSSPRSGFDHWVSFPGQGRYENPPINVNGKQAEQQGFMTDVLNGHALEYLRRKRDRPFSLILSHKAVHGPFTPPARHAKLYEGAPITRHPNAKDDYSTKPALRPKQPTAPGTPVPFSGPGDEQIRNQLRLVQAVDEGVGQIYEALQASGELDRTCVMFTSDNGYLHGDHGLGDKRIAHEESLRIPLIVRMPGLVKPGAEVQGIVLNADFAPTFLDLAGAKPGPLMRGKSFVPLMKGSGKPLRDAFLCEYFEEKQFPRIPSWKAVRTVEWKYIGYQDHSEWNELYNLRKDPFEMNNLIADPASAGMRDRLRARLERLVDETK